MGHSSILGRLKFQFFPLNYVQMHFAVWRFGAGVDFSSSHAFWAKIWTALIIFSPKVEGIGHRTLVCCVYCFWRILPWDFRPRSVLKARRGSFDYWHSSWASWVSWVCFIDQICNKWPNPADFIPFPKEKRLHLEIVSSTSESTSWFCKKCIEDTKAPLQACGDFFTQWGLLADIFGMPGPGSREPFFQRLTPQNCLFGLGEINNWKERLDAKGLNFWIFWSTKKHVIKSCWTVFFWRLDVHEDKIVDFSKKNQSENGCW